MKRWFCGFSSNNSSSLENLPKPEDGQNLWESTNPFWVCGTWAKQQIITLFDSGVRLTIVGTCLEPYESLSGLFHNAIRSGNYSHLMRLPGNYNLIVQEEDQTFIFVDAVGIRPVFYAQYNDGTVYSSLGLALKELLQVEVNPSWLANSLMNFTIPAICQGHSPFYQVKVIPPGHYLHISSGKAICKQYWQLPQEYISFSEAAEKLRAHLLTSVEGRVSLYENVTSDLSGGFDSTSLTLIAAKKLATQQRELHTLTIKARSGIEDWKSAQLAASFFANIIPTMIDNHELPIQDNILDSVPLTDMPDGIMLPTSMTDYWMKTIQAKGSQLHLSGEGGDEALTASYAYLADLLKSQRIRTFLQHAYGWSRVIYRSPLSLIIRAAKLALTSYRQGLLRTSAYIQSQKSLFHFLQNEIYMQDIPNPALAWDSSPEIANWLTEKSLDFVVTELQEWAEIARPFAHAPGQHEAIGSLYSSASTARMSQQVAETYDINLEFPYFDSLVVDTCLSAKPEERTSPFSYKPLLSQALSSDLPNDIFKRQTKCDFSADEYAETKQTLIGLHDIFQTSILADMELIDLKKFREFINRLDMGINVITTPFSQTLAFELWLRRLQDAHNSFWTSSN